MPKLSVIVPVYNVEEYLEDCLTSISNQTFSDFEIIAVNDGTLDRSREILERYLKKESRLKIIDKPNGGLSSARNTGFANSSGKYIHFLDSDDIISPYMYETLITELELKNLCMIKSNLGYLGNVSQPKKPITPNKQPFTYKECPRYLEFISPCASIYKKSLLLEVSLFPEGLIYEDRIFNWETIIKAKRIGHIDQSFYMYRYSRDGSIMSSSKLTDKHFESFKVLELIKSFLMKNNLYDELKVQFHIEVLNIIDLLFYINAIKFKNLLYIKRQAAFLFDLQSVSSDISRLKNYPNKRKWLYYTISGDFSSPHKYLLGMLQVFKKVIPRKYTKWIRFYKKKPSSVEKTTCELYLSIANDRLPIKLRASIYNSLHFQRSTNLFLILLKIFKFEVLILKRLLVLAIKKKKKNQNNFELLFNHISSKGTYLKTYKYFLSNKIPRIKTGIGHSGSLNKRKINLISNSSDLFYYDKKYLVKDRIKNLFVTLKYWSSDRLYLYPYLCDWDAIYKGYHDAFENSSPKLCVALNNMDISDNAFIAAAITKGIKTLLIPHGHPQRSQKPLVAKNIVYFDETHKNYYISLCEEEKNFVLLPWLEILFLDKNIIKTVDKSKTLLFISQLEGAAIHRIPQIVKDTYKAIRELSKNSSISKIIFRPRLSEISDPMLLELLARIQRIDKVEFSKPEKDIVEDIVNVSFIASFSSTALMYSKYFNATAIELRPDYIIKSWGAPLTEGDMNNFSNLSAKVFGTQYYNKQTLDINAAKVYQEALQNLLQINCRDLLE
jgi:glycosyltransferase involved in cell wall biosynthesis